MKKKEVMRVMNQFQIDLGVRIHFLKVYYKNIDVNIYVFAYRGYSNSDGSANEG